MASAANRNQYILAFILLVVMLGYGILIPILPFYIEEMGAGGLEMGFLVASYAVMRLICGPLWGNLSDRIGRKPVLLAGILGYTITMAWFGVATRLWMVFTARILSGVLSSATAPTTMAYIGDCTPEDERSKGMGLLGAAGGIGTILGPVLGGFLAGDSLAAPFFFGAGLSFAALILAFIFLPETHTPLKMPVHQKSPTMKPHTWLEAIKKPIGRLFLLTFISTCSLMIFTSVFGLYVGDRLGFGPQEVGLAMMALGLVTAIGQGALVGFLTRSWGEQRVLRIGLAVTVPAFLLMIQVDGLAAVLLATFLLGLAVALQMPILTSMTSKTAAMSQGIAMGLSNSFVSLGRIVGPLASGVLFDLQPSFPYIGGMIIAAIGFLVCL
jgi:DHA1 family multidrug resistance protein-like MFS transporter